MCGYQIQTQIRPHTDSDGFRAGSRSESEHHRSSDLLHTHPHLQGERNSSITTHNALILTNQTTRFIFLETRCLESCKEVPWCPSNMSVRRWRDKACPKILTFVITEEDRRGSRPCRSAWEQAWGSGWVKSWSAGDLVLITANYREGKEPTVPLSLSLNFSLLSFLDPLIIYSRVKSSDRW